MSLKLRKDEHIFLIGSKETQILGSKLPSLKQVFQVFFFNLRTVKLNIRESANLVIRECIIFWEKARIPTRAVQHCVNKLIKMYENWRNLQKNAKITGEIYRKKENEFIVILDSLFDIAHSDALNIIKIDVYKEFLINQRLPGRPGCLSCVDKKETIKENRREIVDSQISTAAIKKICNHLWYLSEEAAALSFFDESIPFETKHLMVEALKKKIIH